MIIRHSHLIFLFLVSLISLSVGDEMGGPTIYWSAEPVMPGEAAMLQGAGFSEDATIRLQLDDRTADVPVLDANDRSLRFVLPKDWPTEAVQCEINTGSGKLQYTLNSPQPWWCQADEGRRATAGGWIQVCGRCLHMTGEAKLELRGRQAIYSLNIKDPCMWSLLAELPDDVPVGDYELWVNNGSAWSMVDQIAVAKPVRPWLANVVHIDATADDGEDDSEALRNALADVATRGGGVVQFPRGRFRLTGEFSLPPNVVLRGAGMALTHLMWEDADTPPEAFFSSTTGGVVMEDLSLYAMNYNVGLRVKSEKGEPIPQYVRIRRVRVRFTPLSVKGLAPEAIQARLAALGRSAVFQIFANDAQVVDCDLAWTKSVGFAVQGYDIVCVGNQAHAEQGGWCPVGGGRRAIVENNRFTGVTTGITRGAEVFFARNKVAHMYHGFREGFTTDGAFGGPGLLKEAVVTGREIQHAGATARTDPAHIPATVRVIDGTGAGQWRWVERFENKRIVMDRPFDVPVDETSLFYVGNGMARHVLFGNEWSDTGIAAQFYGGGLDCVMADNSSARSGGFRVWGNETAWYMQMLGNRIVEGYGTAGPELNGGTSALHVVGPYLTRNNIRFTGTTVRGVVMRHNRLENNADIILRAAIHDVLIENNTIEHSAKGIVGDLWQRQKGVLLRGNSYQDVSTPYEPVEAGYLKVEEQP